LGTGSDGVVLSPGPRALTVDAVVQIGSAYWLRIPIGKLHNDRYIPLHSHLKERLDGWIAHHRPTDLRSDRLLFERHRPITARGIATALHRSGGSNLDTEANKAFILSEHSRNT
jgi:hypothetical protein